MSATGCISQCIHPPSPDANRIGTSRDQEQTPHLGREEEKPSSWTSPPNPILPPQELSEKAAGTERNMQGPQHAAEDDEVPASYMVSAPFHHQRHKSSSPSSSVVALTGDGVGNTYPEGGSRAWLVVFGSFIGMFASFGLMNSIGVFQAYLSTHQLASYSESTIGWIFSLYCFLSFFCGIQIGPVFDRHGPRWLILAGAICLTASMLLLGVCSKYWHFLLVFGVLAGLGTSLIFTPAISAIGHFFLARRGLATGLAAGGGGAGGVVFPLAVQSLLKKLSFAWTTRILGFIFLFCTLLSVLLVRSRLPPRPGATVMPDFSILRRKSFALTTLGVFMMEWGLFIPITYITSFAYAGGIDKDLSYQLIAFLNAGSVLGRWAPGWFADRAGRFNLMTLALALCGGVTIGLWLPASLLDNRTDQSTLLGLAISYAVVFGFASGSNLGLTPVCVGQLCETEDYGRYYATCYSIVSLSTLTGIPIAGALLQACGGSYWGLIIFTGATYAVSMAAFGWVRVTEVGWGLTQKF